jgi:prepilin-type N-terminal cleavage/methylation domain-containing protein
MKFFMKKGFTLIEILVVITIMGVLTTIVLANYKGLGSDTGLSNVAYDMALSVRQTQSYSLGAQVFNDPSTTSCETGKDASGNTFTRNWGIMFDSDSNYTIYADKNCGKTGEIDENNSKEISKVVNMPSGYKIRAVAFVNSSGGSSQTGINQALGQGNRYLTLVFPKGKANAIISYKNGGGANTNGNSAEICIEASSGKQMKVVVAKTGQVSILRPQVGSDCGMQGGTTVVGAPPPPAAPSSLGSICGNNKCELDESNASCPYDCPATPICGDNICSPGEDNASCSADCPPSGGVNCTQDRNGNWACSPAGGGVGSEQ